MIDSPFFFFLVIAFVSFGIHATLIISFVRRFDALVVALYRGLSLIVTMAPLLLFVPKGEISAVWEYMPLLLLSSGIGAFSFALSLTGSRYLPVGVASSLRQTVLVPVAILLGLFFLGEHLTLVQIILLAGIGSCAIALTLLRSDHDHLDPTKAWRGVFFSACAGIGSAFAWYFFSIVARSIHPFVAAYFGEVLVGVFTLLFLVVLRGVGVHTANIWLPRREAFKIALIALLTISATTSYAVALNHGPFPLAAGIMMGTVLVSTVAAWIIFNERLRPVQLFLIAGGVFLMFLIRIVS